MEGQERYYCSRWPALFAEFVIRSESEPLLQSIQLLLHLVHDAFGV
jgi:hypothetical protein